jgi:hypothetical protein
VTPDHAAAVEAVRARHEADKQHEWPLDHWFDQLQEDRGTLLRAYEAVVEDHRIRTAKARELQIMLDEQRAVLDAALAWESGKQGAVRTLLNAIRAYRAAKEGT